MENTTALDPQVARTLQEMEKRAYTLVIGNKNYSSWSMRPWLVMTAFGIPFKEVRILLDQPDTANRIAEFSNAGRVPVLLTGDMVIWDSLSICEFLAEQFPEKNMWPQDTEARAIARSVCAEMHAGFGALRSSMPMNIRASHPGKGRNAGSQADIGRISEIWEDCFARFGAQRFLFGDFSIADAYYAPVVMRFCTYGVTLAPALNAYLERVCQHPAVAQWVRDAHAEPESLPATDNFFNS
ncbi:glutathione S-transferase family protein [Massilia sp. W12]|uniref:glutathione S-transferase family protein n=1 Tax=Massilia sp. W12 TaxID=3126507 RepID=UPI0030CF8052